LIAFHSHSASNYITIRSRGIFQLLVAIIIHHHITTQDDLISVSLFNRRKYLCTCPLEYQIRTRFVLEVILPGTKSHSVSLPQISALLPFLPHSSIYNKANRTPRAPTMPAVKLVPIGAAPPVVPGIVPLVLLLLLFPYVALGGDGT
jgi:hypothetical protein